jgi:hypothetical protein
VIKGATWLRLPEPQGYLLAVRLVFCGIAVATAWAAHRLARALGASALAAAAGAAFFALAAPCIYFGHRAMSESVAALCATLGFALALPREAAPRRVGAGALLLGLSVIFRLQMGMLCAALALVLVARRAWPSLRAALLGLGVAALALGLLDRLTWGGWFHSALVYLRFNIIEGGAAQWGTSDAAYYARTLWLAAPAPALLLALLALRGAWRAPGLFSSALLFVLAHVATPHKELRFLLPALPLLAALAGLGLDALLRDERAWARKAGAAALAFWLAALAFSAARHRALTWAEVGTNDGRGPLSAYDDPGDVNRLLVVAGKRADLCAVKVEAIHLAWTGGYSYLHRPVRLYHARGPDRRSGLFNYAIAPRGSPGEEVATDGRVSLVRLGDRCGPDPTWTPKLP